MFDKAYHIGTRFFVKIMYPTVVDYTDIGKGRILYPESVLSSPSTIRVINGSKLVINHVDVNTQNVAKYLQGVTINCFYNKDENKFNGVGLYGEVEVYRQDIVNFLKECPYVSISVFTEQVNKEGTFNGEHYDAEITEISGSCHLAVLTGEQPRFEDAMIIKKLDNSIKGSAIKLLINSKLIGENMNIRKRTIRTNSRFSTLGRSKTKRSFLNSRTRAAILENIDFDSQKKVSLSNSTALKRRALRKNALTNSSLAGARKRVSLSNSTALKRRALRKNVLANSSLISPRRRFSLSNSTEIEKQEPRKNVLKNSLLGSRKRVPLLNSETAKRRAILSERSSYVSKLSNAVLKDAQSVIEKKIELLNSKVTQLEKQLKVKRLNAYRNSEDFVDSTELENEEGMAVTGADYNFMTDADREAAELMPNEGVMENIGTIGEDLDMGMENEYSPYEEDEFMNEEEGETEEDAKEEEAEEEEKSEEDEAIENAMKREFAIICKKPSLEKMSYSNALKVACNLAKQTPRAFEKAVYNRLANAKKSNASKVSMFNNSQSSGSVNDMDIISYISKQSVKNSMRKMGGSL